MSRKRVLVACAAAALALLGLGPATAQKSPVGIDVSHHSGEIDWKRVESEGVAFVYLKATEGVDDADPMFESHWQALEGSGVLRGAYHFYVTEDDPEEQARFFLSRVHFAPGDLPPVVDVEVLGRGTQGKLSPELHRFLEIVEKRAGVTPILYTGERFWDAHFGEGFERYPLWVAEYGVDAPQIPEGWSRWFLWQFEGDAEVPGVEKGADRSRIHPEVDLEGMRIPSPSP